MRLNSRMVSPVSKAKAAKTARLITIINDPSIYYPLIKVTVKIPFYHPVRDISAAG